MKKKTRKYYDNDIPSLRNETKKQIIVRHLHNTFIFVSINTICLLHFFKIL